MKILLLNWMDMANPVAGGAEVHLTEIFRRFVQWGHQVTLVCSGFEGGAGTDEYEGIRIIRTGARETFNFKAPLLIGRLDRAEHFDLVVEDINKVPLFTPLYTQKPLLVIIPHLFGASVFRETNLLFGSYVYLLERPMPYLYRDSTFEVISESTAEDVRNRGVEAARVRVVACGMDHDTYSVDSRLRKFHQPTILYVGRIKRYKSVDVILRALPKVLLSIPDARLVIVGSGDHLPELEALAHSLGVADSTTFTGFVPVQEKVNWMRRSHVVVNPSFIEGWGLTNIEANACGTPAVASDVDGLRDSVRHGRTGLLFPYGDHEALGERLVRVLSEGGLRESLSREAIEWAETFTWDKCASQTLQVVEEMLGTNGV